MSLIRRISCISCLAILGLAYLDGFARADVDLGRLILGRTTYPEKSVFVDSNLTYSVPKRHDPTQNTAQYTMDADYGVTDKLSLGYEMQTKDSAQDFVQWDRSVFGARYRALSEPFQLAPYVEFKPSLQRESPNWALGAEALKNYRDFMCDLSFESEWKRGDESGKRQIESTLESGAFYRFGLRGIIGSELEYTSMGRMFLDMFIGSNVGGPIFFGIEPQFGLNRRSANFTLSIQLQVHFGKYALGEWLLE